MSLKINKIAIDAVWVFTFRVGAGFVQLLLMSLLARTLTVKEFGEFQVIYKLVEFFALLGAGGLSWIAFKYLAESVVLNNRPYGNFVLKKIGIIFATSLMLLVLIFIAISDILLVDFFGLRIERGTVYGMVVLIVLISAHKVIPELFRALNDIKYASLFSGFLFNLIFSAFVFGSVLGFYVQSLDNHVKAFSLSVLVTVILSTILLFKLYRNTFSSNKDQPHDDLPYSFLVSAGSKILFSQLIIFIILESNVFIAAKIFSSEVAGYFSIAIRLTFVLSLPLMIANSVMKPRIISMLKKDKKLDLQVILQKVALATTLVTLTMSLPFMLFTDQIITLLYGKEYLLTSQLMLPLVVGHIVNAGLGVSSAMLILAGGQSKLLKITLVGLLVYLILCFMLIPVFKEMGLVYAVVMSQIFYQGFIARSCIKDINIATHIRFR